MPTTTETSTFTLSNCIGSITGEKYVGDFTAKKDLSLEDHITADRTYRDLLGGINPLYANEAASNIAAVVAELSVRLVETPKWWKEVRGGLKLKDTNVLTEIFEAAKKVSDDCQAERAKKAEEAKKRLEGDVPKEEK